ncbi:MAG: CsgG/HfaB family protein, partial [Fibrobacterota bacterium]
MVLRIILLFILVLPTVSVYSQNKIPAGETAPEKQKKMSVAVMPFNGMGELGQVTDILTERLGAELINTGEFKVMERSQMDMVLKEQGFQQTGCTSTECMVEMGQLVGVDRIIAGSIGQLGKKYTINARIINVGTGSVEKAVNVDRVCPIEELTNVMRDVALKLAGGKVENKPSPVAVNPPEKKKKADKEKEVTKRNYMRGWFTSVSAGGGDLAKAIDQSSETNLSVDAFESMTGLGGELGLGITDNFNLGVGMEFLFQTDSDDRKNDNGYDREKLELSYFVFALPINLTAYLHTPRSAAFSVSSFAGMDFYPAVGMNSYYMEERD